MSTPARLLVVLPLLTLSGCAPAGRGDHEPVPLVIRDVTVLTGTEGAPLREQTVVIRGAHIQAVGPASGIRIPAGARVVEGAGRWLVPGLIEMHAHVSKTRASALPLFVTHGVTTVRDMGGEHGELLRWRREIRSGRRLGPRLLLAGPYLESLSNIERMRRDPPSDRVEPFERTRIGIGSPARARAVVDSLARLELDHLKLRTVQDLETYRELNRAADEHGLRLVGHAIGLRPEDVLEAGQDGVEHFFFPTLDSLPRDERMALWRRFAERGVAVVPTLVTFTHSALLPPARLRAMLEDSAGELDPRRRRISRFLLLDWREQALEIQPERQALLEAIFTSHVRNLREMRGAGVELFAGSDVAVLNIFPGSTLHDELVNFVELLGMSPAEALQRATAGAAGHLGIADSVGTIEAGKVADLVLLDADPLADIRNTRRIAAVVLRGRLLDAAGLRQARAAVDTARDVRVNDWPR